MYYVKITCHCVGYFGKRHKTHDWLPVQSCGWKSGISSWYLACAIHTSTYSLLSTLVPQCGLSSWDLSCTWWTLRLFYRLYKWPFFFLFSLLSYKIEMPSKLQILDVMAYYKVCCDNWTCGSCFSFTSNRAVTQLM